MPHSWDVRPDRNVPHVVTCQLCGVVVERRFDENGRGVNFYTELGLEPVRGLAPQCVGAPVEMVADAVETKVRPKATVRKPVVRAVARSEIPQLASKSHQLFMTLAESASAWAGWTLTDGSVRTSPSERGLLNYLRKVGLINIKRERDSKRTLISFTDDGIAYASVNGVDLSWISGIDPVSQQRR